MISRAQEIRDLILEVAQNSPGPTHLGGSLSSVEILTVLFTKIIDLSRDEYHPELSRDLFILSKGHCYLALLATLSQIGRLDRSLLAGYQSDNSQFGAHPVLGQTPDIISSNGSLGHGLGFGLGITIQKKIDCQSGTVYVLLGDGECGEGSVYEAALLAPALKLENLVAIIDSNSFGNDGALPFGSIDKVRGAFSAFGWEVRCVDGHSETELFEALQAPHPSKPLLVVAQTIKGRGLDGIEGSNESHHMKLSSANTKRSS